MTNPSTRKANAHILNHSINHDAVHNQNQTDKLNHLSTDLDLIASSNATLVNQTANNIGIYQAQVHIRDINLPQINTTVSGVKDMTQSTRDACIHLRDVNLPQIHTDIHTLKTSNEGKLDTLEASNQLNKGFLEQIEGHVETISENQSTFQSGDSVVIGSSALPAGASTSALQTAGNGKLDTLEASNQLNKGFLEQIEGHVETISENQSTFQSGDSVVVSSSALPTGGSTALLQTRSWGSTVTLEGNLIVTASSTHSGSNSFTTIPTKPVLIYIKNHGPVTNWFGAIEGSIDNSTWLATTAQNLPVINLTGLGRTPAQRGVGYIESPPFPYLRLVITNADAADRGFEIKYIQTN